MIMMNKKNCITSNSTFTKYVTIEKVSNFLVQGK